MFFISKLVAYLAGYFLSGLAAVLVQLTRPLGYDSLLP